MYVSYITIQKPLDFKDNHTIYYKEQLMNKLYLHIFLLVSFLTPLISLSAASDNSFTLNTKCMKPLYTYQENFLITGVSLRNNDDGTVSIATATICGNDGIEEKVKTLTEAQIAHMPTYIKQRIDARGRLEIYALNKQLLNDQEQQDFKRLKNQDLQYKSAYFPTYFGTSNRKD